MQVILRDLTKEDEPFIYSTWTKNQWYSQNKPQEEKKEWFANKIQEIKSSLKQDQLAIACLKSDPEIILGYIVIKNSKLEWLYVKKDYRKSRIEELLLNQLKENEDGRKTKKDTIRQAD